MTRCPIVADAARQVVVCGCVAHSLCALWRKLEPVRHKREAMRAAARQMRLLPRRPVREIVSSAGLSAADLGGWLNNVDARGGCAEAVRAAAAVGNPAALMHPACPPGVRRFAAASVDPAARFGSAASAGTVSWAARPSRMQRYGIADTRTRPSVDDGCPPAMQAALAGHSDPRFRSAVAAGGTDPYILRVLSLDSRSRIRRSVTVNDAAPTEAVRTLAQDPDVEIRIYALAHKHCPPATLTEAADDRDQSVRHAAASNPACPVTVLRRLAEDSEASIRYAVFSNPAASGMLDAPDDESAAAGMALNPKTGPETIAQLARRWGREDPHQRRVEPEHPPRRVRRDSRQPPRPGTVPGHGREPRRVVGVKPVLQTRNPAASRRA